MSADKDINRNNYEEFFIDYLDGKLSEASLRRLECFLLANPDLREELEGMELAVIRASGETFGSKDQLLNIDLSLPVGEENFPFFAIAASEGDLTEIQRSAFRDFLSAHPEKEEEYQTIQQLRLQPEPSDQYPAKSELKKPAFTVYRRELYAGLALAASLTLLIGLFFILREKPAVTVAQETRPVEERVMEIKTDSIPESIPLIRAVNTSPQDSLKKVSPRSKSVQGIPLQSGFPLASNLPEEVTPEEPLLLVASIDPSRLRSPFPTHRPYESSSLPGIPGPAYAPVNTLSVPTQYLTLQEFAKQKLTSLILGEANEDELSVWTLANAGLNKLNEKAGTEMKLERNTTPEGRTSFLSFSSRLLSFSTPLNREE
jgi:hypothetical protein